MISLLKINSLNYKLMATSSLVLAGKTKLVKLILVGFSWSSPSLQDQAGNGKDQGGNSHNHSKKLRLICAFFPYEDFSTK